MYISAILWFKKLRNRYIMSIRRRASFQSFDRWQHLPRKALHLLTKSRNPCTRNHRIKEFAMKNGEQKLGQSVNHPCSGSSSISSMAVLNSQRTFFRNMINTGDIYIASLQLPPCHGLGVERRFRSTLKCEILWVYVVYIYIYISICIYIYIHTVYILYIYIYIYSEWDHNVCNLQR